MRSDSTLVPRSSTEGPGTSPVRGSSSHVYRLAILYDAGYLVRAGHLQPFDPAWSGAHVTHIVPEEVKEELRRMLGDARQREQARRCQNNIAALMERGPNCSYAELRLKDHAHPLTWDQSLGSDSLIGQLMAGYAKKAAEEGDFTHVILATEDGGLALDVKKLRQDTDLPVYAVAADEDIGQSPPAAEIREQLEAEKLRAGSRRRWGRLATLVGMLAAILALGVWSFETYPMATVAVIAVVLLFGPALMEWALQQQEGKF